MPVAASIAIADSSPVFRVGLTSLVKNAGDYTLVGEASTPAELIELLVAFNPDVVIMDFLSDGFSVDDLVEVRRVAPNSRILAITPQQSGSVLSNALRAGVDSYVKKNCSLGEVMEAIQETSVGGRFFCGQILEAIRKESINVEDLAPVDYSCDPVGLSAREAEVITLIAEGFTNGQIAERFVPICPHREHPPKEHYAETRREQYGGFGHVRCEKWFHESQSFSLPSELNRMFPVPTKDAKTFQRAEQIGAVICNTATKSRPLQRAQ